MWRLHQMATAYGTRPSRALGLTGRRDAWLAYQVDSTVAFWGLYVEKVLAITEKRGKQLVPKYTLEQAIRDPLTERKAHPAQFRSTAGMLGKKL
jgi:hypothetical protein